jgi:hypothetical protein
MSLSIAYISQGQLFLKLDDTPVQEIESEFGQTMQARILQIQRKKSWKNRGIMEMMMPPGAMERIKNQPEIAPPIAIVSICTGKTGQVLYALETAEVGGIFAFDLSRQRENRLFHNSNFRVRHLDFDSEQDLIACTTTYPTGIANIATMKIDGNRPLDVTEGDSLDWAPRWIPGEKKSLVYQSAGLGRVEEGYVGDRTPFRIEKLDFTKQEVVTLASDPKSDLLSPQIGHDGLLYYIRRPYRPRQSRFQILNLLKEIFLMPVRLIYAIFQWLNFFSQTYTGKPLMQTGTNQKVKPKPMQAWGEWLTPDMLKDKNFGEADAPALVPRTWQLVRQGDRGIPEVLAEGVLSYDLAKDGAIAYTNGSGVYAIYANGDKARLTVGSQVESVSIIRQ